MKTRFGLVLATSALIGAGACASGGGGGGAAEGGVAPTANNPDVETIDPGESPRENEHTQAAEQALGDAESAQEDGDEAAAAASFEVAAEAADAAIALDARNPLPWLQGGMAHIGLGNYEVADSMLAEAEELRPLYQLNINPLRENEWLVLYNEAAPLINEGAIDQAGTLLESAHQIYQERPEAMFILGQIRAQQGQFEDAVGLFREGFAFLEDEENRQDVDEEALADWDEQAAGVELVYAQSLVNAGELEEGKAAFQDLLADDPQNMEHLRTLANIFVQMEQPDSASAIYTDLLDAGGLDSGVLYEIGVGLYSAELYDDAARAFREAVADAPRDRDAAEMWARSLQIGHQQGGGEEADTTPEAVLQELLEASETWIEMDPYAQLAYILAAQTVNRMGDGQRATEFIQQAEELPVALSSLQMQGNPMGGATIQGQLQNVAAEAGTQVTLEVTFYGAAEASLGSESVTLELPAVDAIQPFEVVLQSDQPVQGYSYTLEGV